MTSPGGMSAREVIARAVRSSVPVSKATSEMIADEVRTSLAFAGHQILHVPANACGAVTTDAQRRH